MRDKTKQEHFLTFMSNILDKGFAEEVPPLPDTEECWYLPIFGVYHPKKPSQIHVVFDSSAQTSVNHDYGNAWGTDMVDLR